MTDDFHSGFRMGLFIGACVIFIAAAVYINLGKEDCEQNLPRNQECKRVWVAEGAK